MDPTAVTAAIATAIAGLRTEMNTQLEGLNQKVDADSKILK